MGESLSERSDLVREVSVGWRAGAGKETFTGNETFYRRTHGRWGVVGVSAVAWVRGGESVGCRGG